MNSLLRGCAPTALRAYPRALSRLGFVGGPPKPWRHRLRRLYAATAAWRPFSHAEIRVFGAIILSVLATQTAQAAAPIVESAPMSAQSALAWAIALLILSAALAIVEFLVVSWGMLLVGAAISSIAAIALAFHAHPTAGWIFVVIVPVLFLFILRAGFGLMKRNSAAVLPTEITADAGIRQQATQAGVAVGTLGELVTNAFPTGRARFGGTQRPVELDVQVQGAVLSKGERVIVLAIDGAVITVGAARDTVSGLLDTNTLTSKDSSHA